MPQTLSDGDAIAEIANSLIPHYHPEIVNARFKYLFKEKASKKGGRQVPGEVRKASGILEYYAQADFILTVPLDVWNGLDAQKRTALIDHLLERCSGEEAEDGSTRFFTRDPDINEFASILNRHGAYNEALAQFVTVAQSVNGEYDVDEEASESEDVETTSG